ncbi:MAG: methyl-accepting chemotaxis protein [Clostridium sp.]
MENKSKGLKFRLLMILTPLIVIGMLATSIVSIVNISGFSNEVVEKDLENGKNSAQKALEEYFFGIEFRMETMARSGIIQNDLVTNNFDSTMRLLGGLKGANDIILSTVFRSEEQNLIVASKASEGIVIEDEHYRKAIENGHIWIGPHIDKTSGVEALSLYKAVKDGEKAVGVIGMNIDFKDVSVYFSEVAFSQTGYSMLIDKDGTILSNRADMNTVHSKVEDPALVKVIQQQGYVKSQMDINGTTYLIKAMDIDRTDWKLVSLIAKNEHGNEILTITIIQIIMFLIIVIVSVIIVSKLSNTIVGNIHLLMDALKRAGSGNLKEPIHLSAGDERDDIAASYNKMIKDFRGIIEGTKESIDALNDKNESLNKSFVELQSASKQISDSMLQIAQVSNEQARETDNVVGEVEILSGSIEEVSGSINEMNELCNNVESSAKNGVVTISNLVSSSNETKSAASSINISVKNVEESSKEIESIIGLINQISSQTNLLALNAAIEAARVGEQGKGFAVVADEIRSLAEQSKHATDKIQDIIRNMQIKIEETVKSIENVNDTMNIQNENVRETEMSFESIYSGVQVLSQGISRIEELNKNMIDKKVCISDSIQSLAAGIEETSASNEEITAFTDSQLKEVEKVQSLSSEILVINENLVEKLKTFKE